MFLYMGKFYPCMYMHVSVSHQYLWECIFMFLLIGVSLNTLICFTLFVCLPVCAFVRLSICLYVCTFMFLSVKMYIFMRGSRKFFQRGSNFDQVFLAHQSRRLRVSLLYGTRAGLRPFVRPYVQTFKHGYL